VVTPEQRRAVVTALRAAHHLRLRQACIYLGVHRALVRYAARRRPVPGLVARLREVAVAKPRWGSPRLTWRLRREGWTVNHKRIERLVRLEGLRVGARRRRKRIADRRGPRPTPSGPDQRWSMDFVSDALDDGRPFRVWTVVDDATRECPVLIVDRSLPARRVIDGLEMALLLRARPEAIVCDNGPEFTSQALDQWASDRGIALAFIPPGRPVENAFIESFNGKLRDECLNQHHFRSLAEARTLIEAWRVEYNTDRPHQNLGQRTPAEYAASFAPTEDDRLPTTLR
jgi:putative transposase